MKVEKKENFTPVTITLTSQEELDLFTSIFYHVGGSAMENLMGSNSIVVNQLRSAGGWEGSYNIRGTVYIDEK